MEKTMSYMEKRGELVSKLYDAMNVAEWNLILEAVNKIKEINTEGWEHPYDRRFLDEFQKARQIITRAGEEVNNVYDAGQVLFEIIWFGKDDDFIKKVVDYAKHGNYKSR